MHEKNDGFYKLLNRAAGNRDIVFGDKGKQDLQSMSKGKVSPEVALPAIWRFVEDWTDASHPIEDWHGCFLWNGTTALSFAAGTPVYLKIEWRDNSQRFEICSCHQRGT